MKNTKISATTLFRAGLIFSTKVASAAALGARNAPPSGSTRASSTAIRAARVTPAQRRARRSLASRGCSPSWLASRAPSSAADSSYSPSHGATRRSVTSVPRTVIISVLTAMKYQLAVARTSFEPPAS